LNKKVSIYSDFDLFAVALAVVTFSDLVNRLRDNQTAWFRSIWSESQYPWFDNLGLPGALVSYLYQRLSLMNLGQSLLYSLQSLFKETPAWK
jgi:hypothetical protein